MLSGSEASFSCRLFSGPSIRLSPTNQQINILTGYYKPQEDMLASFLDSGMHSASKITVSVRQSSQRVIIIIIYEAMATSNFLHMNTFTEYQLFIHPQ